MWLQDSICVVIRGIPLDLGPIVDCPAAKPNNQDRSHVQVVGISYLLDLILHSDSSARRGSKGDTGSRDTATGLAIISLPYIYNKNVCRSCVFFPPPSPHPSCRHKESPHHPPVIIMRFAVAVISFLSVLSAVYSLPVVRFPDSVRPILLLNSF